MGGGTFGCTRSCFIASKMGDVLANEAADAGDLKEERADGDMTVMRREM